MSEKKLPPGTDPNMVCLKCGKIIPPGKPYYWRHDEGKPICGKCCVGVPKKLMSIY